MHRWMLAFGVLAAVQMIVFVTVASLTRTGYDPTRNWVSQLSLGPGGWLNDLNLATSGAWLIVCAGGLRRRLAPTVAARWAVGLVVCCGVCLVLIAVIRTDPGLGYPPGVPPARTTGGTVHQMISMVLGAGGIAAAALLGRAVHATRAGLLVAVVMAVTFTAATVLVLLDAWGVFPDNPSGLLERVALFGGLCWIAAVCTTLLRDDP